MIGYKAFNHDFTCRGFQYEVGKTYEIEGVIQLCERGFHFCEKIIDCFYYYGQPDARFAKIEALGAVIKSNADAKCVTNKIKILEEIPRDEAVRMTNTGNYNSGYCNSGSFNSGNYNSGCYNSGNGNSGYFSSGNYNSGNYNSGCNNSRNGNSGSFNSGSFNSGNGNSGSYNSGDFNSGSFNSGSFNSGDWNKSSYNNGCFMSVKPVIMMFNKPTSWTIEDWHESTAFDVMRYCPNEYTDTVWDHSGGYLKIVNHKADRQTWWDGLPAEAKREVMNLPNFDADVFYECTGIRVKAEEEE